MKKKFFVAFFVLVSVSASSGAWAADPVTAKARAIPAKMTVGDEIHLYIEVERPKTYSILPLPPKVMVAPFEVKKIESLPPSGKNRIRERFVLTLTVFEVGKLEIRPIIVRYKNPSGRIADVETPPVTVEVVSVRKNPKKNAAEEDIRPIKGPVSFGKGLARNAALGSTAALLALVLAVKLFLRLRGKFDDESLKPAHERVFLELKRLKAKNLLEAKKFKEYYSELSGILRYYLQRRLSVPTLELTTYELTGRLKEAGIDQEVVAEIKRFLEMTDLVKFAKFEPPSSTAVEIEAALTRIVETTKPVPEEKVRK